MYRDDEVELQEMEDDEVGHREMDEEEMKKKLHEFKKYLFVTVRTILCVLNELIL